MILEEYLVCWWRQLLLLRLRPPVLPFVSGSFVSPVHVHSGSDVKKTAKNFEVSFLNFSNDVTFH